MTTSNLERTPQSALCLVYCRFSQYFLAKMGEKQAVKIKPFLHFPRKDTKSFVENNLSQRKGLVIDPSDHNVVSGQVER